MLGKLIKYELKSTTRVFLPLYATLLVVALINGAFINTELFQIQGLLTLVFGALLIAMFVITILVLVQRFSKNLLGDEGYLIFTLPVSSTNILFSKYLVALMWTFLSGVVAFLSFTFMALIPLLSQNNATINEVWYVIKSFLDEIVFNEHFSLIFPIIFNIILGYSAFIFTIYLALSIGQLPTFGKNRTITAFISFVAINVVSSFIQNLLSLALYSNQDILYINEVPDFNSIISLVNNGMIFGIIFNLVLVVGLFFGTKYILDRKLNLE